MEPNINNSVPMCRAGFRGSRPGEPHDAGIIRDAGAAAGRAWWRARREMARPTRFERVTFAFGGQRPHAAIIAWAVLTENVAVPATALSLEFRRICDSASRPCLPPLENRFRTSN